jgi:hypothetical protein
MKIITHYFHICLFLFSFFSPPPPPAPSALLVFHCFTHSVYSDPQKEMVPLRSIFVGHIFCWLRLEDGSSKDPRNGSIMDFGLCLLNTDSVKQLQDRSTNCDVAVRWWGPALVTLCCSAAVREVQSPVGLDTELVICCNISKGNKVWLGGLV